MKSVLKNVKITLKNIKFSLFSDKLKSFKVAFKTEMAMEQVDQIRYIREGLIEQERNKLHSAQAKRIIPVFLSVLDNLGDIE